MADDPQNAQARVCLAAVAGAYGVRGEARLKAFTADPAAIGDYGPVFTEDGARRFDLCVTRRLKGDMVAGRLSGVANKEQADALRGTRLYAPRAALPDTEDADEFYHADLIGLRAEDPEGRTLGVIRAVFDFGAGDLLEIVAPDGRRTELAPFTREVVPKIDLAAGVVIVAQLAEAADTDDGPDEVSAPEPPPSKPTSTET